jgi:hypothetical protein
MNDISPGAIKTELDEIKSEVRSLKGLVVQLSKLLERGRPTVNTITLDELDMSDPTPDELMLYASHVFGVSSQPSPDDDLIAPDAVIKPVDFSGYA